MDSLPDFLHLRILSHVPGASLVPPSERLPPVHFEPLSSAEGLPFWSPSLVQELNQQGFIVVDHIGVDWANVRSDIMAMRAANKLVPAKVLRADATLAVDRTYRGDLHLWWREEEDEQGMSAVRAAVQELTSIARQLRDAYPLCFDWTLTETQLTVYPKGGHYVRHLDASKGKAEGRLLTFVYYANPPSCMGGELKLYREDNSHVMLAATADRLVVFQSRTMEHEVLECNNTDRVALSMWFVR